jgi:hypothetical protein
MENKRYLIFQKGFLGIAAKAFDGTHKYIKLLNSDIDSRNLLIL